MPPLRQSTRGRCGRADQRNELANKRVGRVELVNRALTICVCAPETQRTSAPRRSQRQSYPTVPIHVVGRRARPTRGPASRAGLLSVGKLAHTFGDDLRQLRHLLAERGIFGNIAL